MNTYFLRVEGVNLSNFVYDTQDLSTVRGGGLLLLDVVVDVPSLVRGLPELKEISRGASTGLFRFEADDDTKADGVRQKVESQLNADARVRHATFVVDVAPDSDNFVADREKLLALNHWRQMQQPTVAVPVWNTDAQKRRQCEIDFVRPAISPMPGPEGQQTVSTSVAVRREYGRTRKQTFYSDYSDVQLPRKFALSFDELTEFGIGDANALPHNLRHKMAVVYLDGNGFGKIQNDFCKTPTDQTAFDETVRHDRRTALNALLEWMVNDESGWVSKEGNYRLETLLWGGDELIWVVPAWKGWETLALFYRMSQDWIFESQSSSGPHPELTHCAGLIFCHQNAPIHRITRLAHQLAEAAKSKAKKLKGRDKNLFAYEVLESYDHTGDDLDTHRRQRVPFGLCLDNLVLSGTKMDEATGQFTALKETLPRRQLYQIIQSLRTIPGNDDETAIHPSFDDLVKGLPQVAQHAVKSLDCFEQTNALWFQLAELWDYIG